jgi:hypothetical protein
MVRPLRKMRIPQGRCPATGKLRFTRAQAQGAVADAVNSGRPYRRECRYYECPDCGAWHLTSLETYEGVSR